MKPKSVCVILENTKKEILLLLRDDKTTIQYPNQWVILGGQMENDEEPEEAIRREIREEIEAEMGNLRLIKTYEWPEKTEYVFYSQLDINPKNTPLHEGQEIRYFPKDEISHMQLAFHDNQIIEDFLT